MNEKESIKQIVTLIEDLQRQMEAHLPLLQQEVEQIIQTKSTDSKAIEHIFDTLYGYLAHGMGEGLYIQLLQYYKTVDAEGAAFYWDFFEEAMEE